MGLHVRPAVPGDCLNILYWRNDPDTRAMSRNGSILDQVSHEAWYDRALKDPQRLLLIGEDESGSIAMVRFDIVEAQRWEVSIVLCPESRGKGKGRPVLSAALDYFSERHAGHQLLAAIKIENVASQRLFLSLGFKEIESKDEMRSYVLNVR